MRDRKLAFHLLTSLPADRGQIGRAHVRWRGRKLSYFGGCDYFRLSSHPTIIKAVTEGLRRFGLNVAASRLTTGNHPLYEKLEGQLARFFGSETALLVGSGYVTTLAVAQSIAGRFSHALIDNRTHVALKDAIRLLDCPILRFKHRDIGDFEGALRRCGPGALPVVLTDGMFSHDGSVAPLAAYLKLLPRDGLLVVDDAHGAGILGKTGKGAVELEGVTRSRVAQCVTLSKAFGVYGGAVLCSRAFRNKMIERSNIFIGSTPLPLPLAYAASEAVRVLKTDTGLRRRLNANAAFVKSALRESFSGGQGSQSLLTSAATAFRSNLRTPGPIVSIEPTNRRTESRLKRALLSSGILPPFINYPGGARNGYFRFTISSEHTRKQLESLVDVLVRNA
jgi:7-keto-8-aminopelargonate synthetase-like enzyme